MPVRAIKVRSHHIIHDNVGPQKGQVAGATVKRLTLWPDDRGHFAEVFRDSEEICQGFRVLQSSVTLTRAGVIKAFHYHLEQDDIFCPLRGSVRIALVDFREDSPTHGVANSIFCGALYPKAVRIPKGVAHGYEVLPGEDLLMVYYTNQYYNPKDEFRFDWNDPEIGFSHWGVQNR